MRGIVFAVMLIAGVAFGASAASAQSEYTNIGGDLNWPATPSVAEEPAQAPQIGNAATSRGTARRESTGNPSSGQASGQGGAQASQGPSQAAARANPQAYDDDATNSTQGKRRKDSSEQETEKLPPVPMRAVRVSLPSTIAAVSDDEPSQAAPSIPSAAAPPSPSAAAPIGPSQAAPVAATLTVAPPAEPLQEPEPAAVDVAPAPVVAAPPPAVVSMAPAAEPEPEPAPKPDPMIARMAGQMLIVGFDGAAPEDPSTKQIIAQIEAGRIGGVVVANRNVQSPAQLTKLMNALRRTKATTTPFLAVEQEGGSAQALMVERGFRAYPSARDLGDTNDPLIAYSVYQTLASELAGFGFNLNLGPVLDVQHGAATPADDDRRTYGPQPKHVAAFAKAFRIAHQDAGLLTALKHFPGQGSLHEAPDGPADIEAQWADSALEPYRELVDNGSVDIVMMGHLTHSGFSDEPGMPASLSEKAIKRLREDVGFTGVVLSDDIEAGAVSTRFPLEDRVLRAIKSGSDLLLIGQRAAAPSDLPDRIAAIIGNAVMTGALSRDQLQASYDRILALKQRLSPAAQALVSKRDGAAPASPTR